MPNVGFKHTEESKKKMSEAHKNISDETRKKMSKSRKGKKHSPEAIEKMRVAKIDREVSEETREKIRITLTGRKPTPETRAKLVEARKRRKQTPEEIAKSAATRTGMKRTEETKAKIRESWKHRAPASKETCKKISDALKGKNNGRWKGGSSFFPYCEKFNDDLKERVRENYGRTCVECGKTEEENGNIKLDVHHITYNKNSCCDGSKPLFVALCHSCHSRTNGKNRDYYEEKYTNLINEKYNGKCYLSKEEYNLIKQKI